MPKCMGSIYSAELKLSVLENFSQDVPCKGFKSNEEKLKARLVTLGNWDHKGFFDLIKTL